MSELSDQLLSVWRTSHEKTILVLEAVSDADLDLRSTARGAISVAGRFAAVHEARADHFARRAPALAEGLARYEEMVTEPVTRMLANWAGLRTFSPDRNIVIGHDAAQPSFFWLAGQGGQGFQSCPAASQLAADLLCGRATGLPDRLLADVSPRRFA